MIDRQEDEVLKKKKKSWESEYSVELNVTWAHRVKTNKVK